MTATVLGQRRLNRALLARQLLLERSSLSIPHALESIAGIQNQYAPNAYIRLWSCLEGFRRVVFARVGVDRDALAAAAQQEINDARARS